MEGGMGGREEREGWEGGRGGRGGSLSDGRKRSGATVDWRSAFRLVLSSREVPPVLSIHGR
jgi:hypothetical protein